MVPCAGFSIHQVLFSCGFGNNNLSRYLATETKSVPETASLKAQGARMKGIIEVICQSLYQADDGETLKRFFTENASLPILSPNFASQTVLIAYICTLLHGNKFDAMFDLLKSSRFEEKYFKELQDLWHRGRYKENETKRGKELGAVEKYRLRRKYPPPSSIWDGQETVYSFKENSRKKLKDFYEQNPYPTLDQKKEISRVTDLEIVQISNWFKNRRQRDKTSPKDVYRGTMALQQTFAYGNLPIMNPIPLNRRIHM